MLKISQRNNMFLLLLAISNKSIIHAYTIRYGASDIEK